MRNKILIVLPSRGRPWKLLESIASIQSTSSSCDILVCTDSDDLTSPLIRHPRVMHWSGPRKSFVQWVNLGVKAFVHDYWVFAWGADDVLFKTEGWDDIVMTKMSRKDDIIYGSDGVQNEKLPTHPFVGCAYPRSLGYFIYPALKHYYADNWFHHLGKSRNRITYVPEIKTTHRHHCNGSSKVDQTYTDANKRYFDADYKTFVTEVYGASMNNVDITRSLAPIVDRWVQDQPIVGLHF